MAAGLGFKDFQTGEVLTAADVDGYLMQGIWVFASTAARNAAVTSPQEGNFAFTKDTNSLWYYDGAAWVASGATGDIEGVTAGIGISGGGTSGTVTVTNSMATAIDAKGDLVAGTGADTFAKLTVGANGTTLVADSAEATGLKWQAPATFLARINTNQSITSSTITKVAFDTEIIDTASGYDPTTNYRFTVPAGQGGYYLIGFDVAWGVYTAGHQVFMYIYKNGSAYEAPLIPFRDSGSDVVATGTFSKVVELAATDYVEAYVQHNRGSAATLYSPNANFWGHKI